MITIFEIGNDLYWTGRSRSIDDGDGCPPGWTRSPVPSEIPDGQAAKWSGNWLIVDEPVPTTTTEEINDERSRRILAGGTFLGIPVTGDDQTITNLTNLAFGASLRVSSGDTTTITVYRDAVNTDHDLTPLQIIGLWQASAAYVSSLYQKSWDLKAMDPIPLDYTDDSYWT